MGSNRFRSRNHGRLNGGFHPHHAFRGRRWGGGRFPIFDLNPEGSWVTAGPSVLSNTLELEGAEGTHLFRYDGQNASSSGWTATVGEDLTAGGSSGSFDQSSIYHDTTEGVKFDTSRWYEDTTNQLDIGTDDLVIELVFKYSGTQNRVLIGNMSNLNQTGIMVHVGADLLTVDVDDGVSGAQMTATIVEGQTYHVLATVDRNGLSYLYVNGVQEGTTNNSGSTDGVDTGLNMHVGIASNETNRQSNCTLYYVSAWSRAAGWLDGANTAAESLALAQSRSGQLFAGGTGRGGIGQLPQSISMANGNVGTLMFRYEAKDSNTTNWTATGTGNTLTAAGSGGTFDLETPTHGANDKAIDATATRYFEDSGTTQGDITTEDFVLEFIATGQGISNGTLFSKRDAANAGWLIEHRNSGDCFRLLLENGGGTVVTIQTSALTDDAWYHCLVFIDRSGNAQWYINGVADSTLGVSGVSSTLTNSGNFRMLADGSGGVEARNKVAYAAGWTVSDIGTHLQADLAQERFARLTGTYIDGTQTYTRATVASLVKEISAGQYQLFHVGAGWPRICTDPTDGEGYLPELAATNLCLQSEDVGTTWSTQASATTNVIAAPDGATTADGLFADGTSLRRREQAITTVISTDYTFSLFVKNGTSGNNSWVAIADRQGGGLEATSSVWFDLSNGTKGTDNSDGAGIEDWGNGWYRIWTTFDATTTATNIAIVVCNGDNVTTSTSSSSYDFAVWGMQFEAKEKPSSYIPTTTVSATRDADILSYTVEAQSEFSLITIQTLKDIGVTRASASLNDGGSTNERVDHRSDIGSGDKSRSLGVDGGATQWNTSGTITTVDGSRHTMTTSAKVNDITIYVDGAVDSTDTSATIPTFDTINVGHQRNASQLDGILHRVKLYKVAGVAE